MTQITISSPLGELTMFEVQGKIVCLKWGPGQKGPSNAQPTKVLLEAASQLKAYFAKALKRFDLPLSPLGTNFQRKVSGQMLNIPFGKTQTYGEIARRLKTSARAVGNACGHNTIPIIVPCHRVVSASGIGGYSGHGGQNTKLRLLKLEGVNTYISKQYNLIQPRKNNYA